MKPIWHLGHHEPLPAMVTRLSLLKPMLVEAKARPGLTISLASGAVVIIKPNVTVLKVR
jgi:hypothetical protein